MRHALRRAWIPLTVLMLALPLASAGTQVGLGEVLAPGFGLADGLFEGASSLVPSPAAPVVDPLLGFGRLALDLLRAAADATILGATDGDAGSSFGAPDEVGVRSGERVLAEGVEVPAQDVEVPGQTIVVGTPEVDRTVRTPAIHLPPRQVTLPEREVAVDTPRVAVPAVVLETPPVALHVPAVGLPGVRLETPEVDVPEREVALDASRADLVVQSLHGEVYLGPAGSVPYETEELRVGQSTLPSEVPRQVGATVPGLHVPGMVLVDDPAREVLPAQQVPLLPAQRVEATGEMEVLPAQHVPLATIPAQSLSVPGASVPAQEQRVHVPGQTLHEATVPGQEVHTPPVEVTDERIALPAVEQVLPLQGPVDSLGYVGYGFDDDSSLYPFACGPLIGCRYGSSVLRPYVGLADAYADFVAGTVDGGIVVEA